MYKSGVKQPIETIKQGLEGAVQMAFDGAGSLYVGNLRTVGMHGGVHPGTVMVYPPGKTQPSEQIRDGVTDVTALALGR